MDFAKMKSLKASLFGHLTIALFVSVLLSLAVQNITAHTYEQIALKYIDTSEYYAFSNEYIKIIGDKPLVPQLLGMRLEKQDRIIKEVCDFLQTWSAILITSVSVYAAMSLFYKKRLKNPINLLEESAEKIGNQELDFYLEYKRADEMGHLCSSFEKMREQLQINNSQMWRMIEEQKQMRAAFSHDLRTPLAVLKGYVEYLLRYYPKDKLSREKIMETLFDLQVQIQRIEAFCNTMKDTNRLHDVSVQREPIEVMMLLKRTRDVLDILSDEYKKQYLIQEEFLKKTVNIDLAVYLEILENIVANAMRYAKQQVRLEIGNGQKNFYIKVCDDGPGFSQEELEKAAAPYFHGKESEEQHYGMGLYICSVLCKKHKGAMDLSNEKDGGACVQIELSE